MLALIGMPDGRNEAEVVVDPALLPRLGRSAIRNDDRQRSHATKKDTDPAPAFIEPGPSPCEPIRPPKEETRPA